MTYTVVIRPVYTIYVCPLCGGEDFMSNTEDSYCNECKEWMNCETVEVVPKEEKYR